MTEAVIHKVVFDLDLVTVLGAVDQAFQVPRGAQLVAVDWDTRHLRGIAVWFRDTVPLPTFTGERYLDTWNLTVRGTGHPYPGDAQYLGTVVREGFAWHLLDLDGTVRR